MNTKKYTIIGVVSNTISTVGAILTYKKVKDVTNSEVAGLAAGAATSYGLNKVSAIAIQEMAKKDIEKSGNPFIDEEYPEELFYAPEDDGENN